MSTHERAPENTSIPLVLREGGHIKRFIYLFTLTTCTVIEAIDKRQSVRL